MSNTVHVSNIASTTGEKEVRDFFTFCGKITSLSLNPSSGEKDATQSATVTFEKETAAKTALLLDQTQLGSSSVHVTSARSIDEIAGSKTTDASHATDENNQDLEQEDKPRSRIFAEYLAHGYVISDNAIERAIDIDKKHGFSSRFQTALANFDKKYHATDKAKGLDENYKITETAERGWKSLSSYFEKALGTPTGQKIRDFYVNSNKQVQDIHTEARRLADLKREKSPGVEGSQHKEQPTGGVPVTGSNPSAPAPGSAA
ncbi:Protein vip1 [Ophidiomyces ophidiicola]|uniref:Protein vip1 n=1 Tax=Ophidiomyces ophidiicola TaxID=1387563 RepID=UPI0020C38A14|nr:Protein vip1 [Ophidiomyces ophidiicola]KAI1951912.1 Protein vip1 [Ophidiomyces ophidiicola]KAI2045327.1 Protein vip1 [Ophidiomyces ophidiicola]